MITCLFEITGASDCFHYYFKYKYYCKAIIIIAQSSSFFGSGALTSFFTSFFSSSNFRSYYLRRRTSFMNFSFSRITASCWAFISSAQSSELKNRYDLELVGLLLTRRRIFIRLLSFYGIFQVRFLCFFRCLGYSWQFQCFWGVILLMALRYRFKC